MIQFYVVPPSGLLQWAPYRSDGSKAPLPTIEFRCNDTNLTRPVAYYSSDLTLTHNKTTNNYAHLARFTEPQIAQLLDQFKVLMKDVESYDDIVAAVESLPPASKYYTESKKLLDYYGFNPDPDRVITLYSDFCAMILNCVQNFKQYRSVFQYQISIDERNKHLWAYYDAEFRKFYELMSQESKKYGSSIDDLKNMAQTWINVIAPKDIPITMSQLPPTKLAHEILNLDVFDS